MQEPPKLAGTRQTTWVGSCKLKLGVEKRDADGSIQVRLKPDTTGIIGGCYILIDDRIVGVYCQPQDGAGSVDD